MGVAFDGGRWLATTWRDGAAVWPVGWDGRLGEPLKLPGSFGVLAFGPDGKTLIAAQFMEVNFNNSVALWDLSFESWLERARRIVGRDLTDDEWQRYVGSDITHEPALPDHPSVMRMSKHQ